MSSCKTLACGSALPAKSGFSLHLKPRKLDYSATKSSLPFPTKKSSFRFAFNSHSNPKHYVYLLIANEIEKNGALCCEDAAQFGRVAAQFIQDRDGGEFFRQSTGEVLFASASKPGSSQKAWLGGDADNKEGHEGCKGGGKAERLQ
jgi:hypothetical protein